MPLAATKPTIIPASGAGWAASPSMLPTPYVAQCQTNWCWAACFEMIRTCLGMPSIAQCEMASTQFPVDCCVKPCGTASTSDPCNRTAIPEQAAPACGLTCSMAPGPAHDGNLDLPEIHAEIDAGRPVELSIDHPGGGGHVVLVVDYHDDGYLRIYDPWPAMGAQTIHFDDLKQAYNGGTWSTSYFAFTPL